MEQQIEQIADAARTMRPDSVCFEISSYTEFTRLGQNGCGHGLLAHVFFLSFHYVFSLFVVPVLVALIVDSYADLRRLEQSLITRRLLNRITIEWTNIDPSADGLVGYR